MMDDALKTDHPWMKGITRERLDRENHIRLKFDGDEKPFLPFAEGKFPTPVERRSSTAKRWQLRGSIRL